MIGVAAAQCCRSVFLLLAIGFSALLATSTTTYAQVPSNVAVVIGVRSAWTIEAPEGWRLDAPAAVTAGLGAAFVPEEGSWGSSGAVMYAITLPKGTDNAMSIDQVIRHDSIRTAARRPGTTVTIAETIETIEGVDALVRHSFPPEGANGTIEAVAYLNTPTVVACIVLSARTPEDFTANLAAFARLVDSYEWITADAGEITRLRAR